MERETVHHEAEIRDEDIRLGPVQVQEAEIPADGDDEAHVHAAAQVLGRHKISTGENDGNRGVQQGSEAYPAVQQADAGTVEVQVGSGQQDQEHAQENVLGFARTPEADKRFRPVKDNIISFPSRLHEGSEVAQVLCQSCGSRAMRLVGNETDSESWDVECHNCGNEQTGLKVLWTDGTN
jgi:hypothetical protein